MMADLIQKYEVFLHYWKKLIQDIESVEMEKISLLRNSQFTKFEEQAVLILEECFGSEADTYIKIIESTNKLKPESEMERFFDQNTMYKRVKEIDRNITKILEDLKKRQEIQSRLKTQPKPLKKHEGKEVVLAVNSNRIFLVHGHDNEMVQHVARIVRKLGLDPVILHEQRNRGRTIIEKFEEEASDVRFAIILLSPDDEGRLRGAKKLSPRARQNVIFEHGFFIGKIGRERVVALYRPLKDFKRPSDIEGIIYISYDPNSLDWAYKLCDELKDSGYSVSKDLL